jgi:hypothetical protein
MVNEALMTASGMKFPRKQANSKGIFATDCGNFVTIFRPGYASNEGCNPSVLVLRTAFYWGLVCVCV